MKKLILAGAAFCALVLPVPAFAADMALKAPSLTPADPWNGWFIGANIGGSFGQARDSTTAAGTPFSATSASLNGFVGGGQLGYNWHFSPSWVFGLEADIQGTSERSSASVSVTRVGGAIGAFPVTGTLADAEQLPWFGTARARIGFLPTPGWLVYATGGLAYGQINSNETFSIGAVAATSNFNTIRAGWTAGGGIEAAIGGSWTAKLEYLYVDFGTFGNTFAGLGGFAPIGLSTHLIDNIVRIGVDYHLPPTPLAARY